MIMVRGECKLCHVLIKYGDPHDNDYPAVLFMTIPGQGAFAGTIFKAELFCKDALGCMERQRANAA